MSLRSNNRISPAPQAAAERLRNPSCDSRRRSQQGGFILLTLLFFAGAVAFMLVIALPRSAMQAQRVREETLIYRGEQYKRAVQLYFRKYKKYPAKLDDLEESDGVRFLRRRYKDPLTGEDEWRLVHMGADGRFKDSVLFDLETEEDGKEGMQAGGAGLGGAPGVGKRASPAATVAGSFGVAQNAFRGADLARAERQSAAPDLPGDGPSAAEVMAAGLAGAEPADGTAGNDPAEQGEGANPAAQGEQAPGGAVPYPNYANTLPSQIPSPTGAGALANTPAANNPNGQPAGVAQTAEANPPANQQSSNRRISNARGRRGGVMQPGITAGMAQRGRPANMPPAGLGSPGMTGSAADLIRNLLTTPRPGGLAGLRGAQGAQAQARPNFAEGIAGVASRVEQRGVKVYNEREFYNEWEFVYDYRQDAAMTGLMGGAGQAAGNMTPGQPGIGPGGTLNIDPSQMAPVPGMPGFPSQIPPGTTQPGDPAGQAPPEQAGSQPGLGQPADPGNPNLPGAPPLPGTSPFDPAQPPATPTTTRPDRNSRRRRSSPPPLPGQSIYPGLGATPTQPGQVPNQPGQVPGQPGQVPNQPGQAPGQPSPFGVPGQPPAGTQNPNQPTTPQNRQPQNRNQRRP